MKIKVSNKLKIYEVNGTEPKPIDGPQLEVLSHWNRQAFVVLKFGSDEVTVLASDLDKAIENAKNH